MGERRNPRVKWSIITTRDLFAMRTKQISVAAGTFMALIGALYGMGGAEICRAQSRPMLVSGSLYRIHAGFLELQSSDKKISVVKVDSETIYWNGKTDKVAGAKELRLGDEVVAEVVEKKGALAAQKVRFLHHEY